MTNNSEHRIFSAGYDSTITGVICGNKHNDLSYGTEYGYKLKLSKAILF